MLEVLKDGVLDALKALPFLFGAYLLIEFLEHRASGKLAAALSRIGPLGPLGGAVLGCVPQCGFSVAAANFYTGRLISPGTLLAVFLATSDEALPMMLSRPQALPDLGRLLLVKLAAASLFGLVTDLAVRKFIPPKPRSSFQELHESHDHKHNVLQAALGHTLRIFLFLLLVNLLLGYAIYFVGDEAISRALLSGSIFQPLVAALIGFIPNCAASVILTELYLSGSLSFGAAVAGLCTGAGMGLAVLFKTNRHVKENLCLAGALYLAAVITGTLCNLFPAVAF